MCDTPPTVGIMELLLLLPFTFQSLLDITVKTEEFKTQSGISNKAPWFLIPKRGNPQNPDIVAELCLHSPMTLGHTPQTLKFTLSPGLPRFHCPLNCKIWLCLQSHYCSFTRLPLLEPWHVIIQLGVRLFSNLLYQNTPFQLLIIMALFFFFPLVQCED